ncbi:hypothetical protein PV08_11245 [Exophiala spinifera]|uniref:Uncharacterized protein n=1 Tax=Exophiala spinifera TaxID=91928 RepID=A0A0D2AU57_9EURO|nr:uncharacterized protein PV08_11245 [Exophiala spinifera]KIW10283.1 hypothetical protein PV08_11245 [Exophiala spinifera]
MSATSTMNTILIVGGTSGIGESFARRFHSMGKKVIITGRRAERLQALKSELPGLETYIMDNTDIASLPAHVQTFTTQHPDIDTVWVNSGIQYTFDFKTTTSVEDDAKINREIATNVTAPMILARHFVPFLLKRPDQGTFMITSSGLAFVPMGIFPIYCPTKAFVHHFMVGLRQRLTGTHVNVIEIAPPYVETDLDAAHKQPDLPPPMPLAEYTDKTFEILNGKPAKEIKEAAVGFAAMGAEAWRGAFGGFLEHMKLGG